jgi:hypothetical protein
LLAFCVAFGCGPEDDDTPPEDSKSDVCKTYADTHLPGTWLENREHLEQLHASECTIVEGTLRVVFIPGVEDLSMLENIREARSVEIAYAQDLESLNGLQNLTTFNKITIHKNPELHDTSALQSSTVSESIEDSFSLFVTHNESLQVLEGLEGTTRISQLYVVGNDELSDVPALDDFATGSTERLFVNARITKNPKLPRCRIDRLLSRVPEDSLNSVIEGNDDRASCE